MPVKEVTLSSQSPCEDDITNLIQTLAESEFPIVLRSGLSRFSMPQWHSFLSENCSLKEDKRHYSTDQQLVESDWWEISYNPAKASTYAHSNTRQPMHTDNAWFADPAEINFFVMQKQAESGGEQTIYPLSRLQEDLLAENRSLYEDLISIPVTIQKGDDEYQNHTPIIVEHTQPRIFWNYYRTLRDNKDIDNMCEQFFRFLEKKESSSSVIKLRAESGDCFAFNDSRLLHGRLAFNAQKPRDRVLYQSMWKLK